MARSYCLLCARGMPRYGCASPRSVTSRCEAVAHRVFATVGAVIKLGADPWTPYALSLRRGVQRRSLTTSVAPWPHGRATGGLGAGGGCARPHQPVCCVATTPRSGPLIRRIHEVAGLGDLAPARRALRALSCRRDIGARWRPTLMEQDGGSVTLRTVATRPRLLAL